MGFKREKKEKMSGQVMHGWTVRKGKGEGQTKRDG